MKGGEKGFAKDYRRDACLNLVFLVDESASQDALK